MCKPTLLEKAILMATMYHTGQKDQADEPYILHPLRVMNYVWHGNVYQPRDADYKAPEKALAVAMLHDVLEDCDVDPEELTNMGMPEEVVATVKLLTHAEEDSYDTYVRRIKDSGNEIALQVKLADLADNTDPKRMLVVKKQDPEAAKRRVKKYTNALEILTGKTYNIEV